MTVLWSILISDLFVEGFLRPDCIALVKIFLLKNVKSCIRERQVICSMIAVCRTSSDVSQKSFLWLQCFRLLRVLLYLTHMTDLLLDQPTACILCVWCNRLGTRESYWSVQYIIQCWIVFYTNSVFQTPQCSEHAALTSLFLIIMMQLCLDQ